MRVKYVLSEVLVGLWRNVTMTIAMIITMAVSLAMLGSGLIAVRDDRRHKDLYCESVDQVSLTRTSGGRHRLQPARLLRAQARRWQNSPLVASLRYESKEQAYKRFQQLYQGQRWPRWCARSAARDVAAQAERPGGGARPSARRGRPGRRAQRHRPARLVAKLFDFLSGVRNLALAVAVVMAIAALLLVANTIQVAAFSRRREVGVMRLVGATHWYTQAPFLLEAVVAGVVGAVLASLGILVGQVPVHRRPAVRDRQQRPDPADQVGRRPVGLADPADDRRRGSAVTG